MSAPIEPITLLTDVPAAARRASLVALKRLLGIGRAGPAGQAVRSLRAGFAELSIPYRLDPERVGVSRRVGVFASVKALRWALAEKKAGRVTFIVAGPDLAISPEEHDRLLMDPGIDVVLFSSASQLDTWTRANQSFLRTGRVWIPGVSDRGARREPVDTCLVHSVGADQTLFTHIMRILWDHKLTVSVSAPGRFSFERYERALSRARYAVYLAPSGADSPVARAAAMADVPLIWWRPDEREAPVPAELGVAFSGVNDFEAALQTVLAKPALISPRRYALGHFTDAIVARHYADLFV